MELKANHPRSAAALLILCGLIAFALFFVFRPLRLVSPASGSGQALVSLDEALGATVEPVDPATARMLGMSSNAGDLVVTSVGTGGPAAAAGMRVGDVVERIGGKPAAASAPPTAPVAVEINRGGKHAILQIAFTARSSR
jgi:predicted metalloprotease with PDZ domain